MTKQHDYYQARAAHQRAMAAELTGSAREQHLTLAAMYEALATEPKAAPSASKPADGKAPLPEEAEDEAAYFQRRAREERARAADTDDPVVRRIRFEMADEYLRRAEAAKS